MKRRGIIVLVIVALFAGAVWWWQSPGSVPEKIASAPSSSTVSTVSAAPETTPAETKGGTHAIALPAVAPAPKPAESTPTPAEPDAATEDQKKINTMLASAIDQIQNGNLVDVFETFQSPDSLAQMKPDTKIALEEPLRDREATPGIQATPEIQIWIQVLQAMKDQTPTYNDAGDQATYAISDPTGRGIVMRPLVLHKVNGQWYFTGTGILLGVIGFGLNLNPPLGL